MPVMCRAFYPVVRTNIHSLLIIIIMMIIPRRLDAHSSERHRFSIIFTVIATNTETSPLILAAVLSLPPRPFTAPEMALKKQGLVPLPGYKNQRPSTSSLDEGFREHWAASTVNPSRPNTCMRWRWRVGLTSPAADASASKVRTPSTAASRGGYSSRQSSPSAPSAIWDYGGGGGGREIRRKEKDRGRYCSCPMEICRGCSASKR